MSSGDTWGWMVTTTDPTMMFELSSPFTVGRDPSTCSLVINEELYKQIDKTFQNQNYSWISRRHFIVNKKTGEKRAVLTDLSMNGTWVNGVKVGMDRQMILGHCSVISILDTDSECFRYIDRDTMESLYTASVTQKYIVGEVLGMGSTSVVRRGYKKVSGGEVKTYALKIISVKDDSTETEFRKQDSEIEIRIMKSVNHPCILKLYDVVMTPKSVILVMERAVGGELFDAIVKDSNENKLSEHTVKVYFYQIVHCVRHLHRMKLCHRDLKLENILIGEDKIGEVSILKVTDFGFSKSCSGSCGPLKSYAGTPVYMAPEVFRLEHGLESENGDTFEDSYSSKVDCWSLGVILYTMLCGKRPFSSGADLQKQIMAGRFRPMEGHHWDEVSAAAKALVTKLLDVDPETRWSADQVIEHKWFIEDEAAVNVAKALMFKNKEEEMENFDNDKN